MRIAPLFAGALLAALAACGPGRADPPSDGPEPEEAPRVRTGYGSERPETSTATVASIEGRDVPRGTSLADMLDRVPGVEVRRLGGADFSVRIRGVRSITSTNEPLFVVDGTPRTATSLEALIPSSIVRIDVLKDAGSLAAYGARGANGVVLITTEDAP